MGWQVMFTQSLFLSCVACGGDILCEEILRLYSHDWGEVTCAQCKTKQQWEIRIEVKK